MVPLANRPSYRPLRACICAVLVGSHGGIAAGDQAAAAGAAGPWTILDRASPGEWDSDGLWQTRAVADGVEFLKDKTPRHNSMCWLRLARPLGRGQTVEVRYRMEVPYKHVDLVLGTDLARPDPEAPMPPFAEVLSLGDRPSTDWQTRRLTVTSGATEINTLGFLAWGWEMDRGTWMRVDRIRVLPRQGGMEWFVWRVPPHENRRTVPCRSPLQDFFPFGVTLHMEFAENYRYEGLRDRWEWVERCLADIRARGMNYTMVANLGEADLDRVVRLHAKYGLRLSPQVDQFNVKYSGTAALKPFIRAVAAYRGNPTLAGWSVGEEFTPEQMPLLDLPYEIVPAVDPGNTMVTIQCRTDCFKISGDKLDVRIQFRDFYPFFADPLNGPTSFEASMRCYEEIFEQSWSLLPRGASLWAMPQAGHAYDSERGLFVFRQPTPAEIRLQVWTALAIGAQGFAFYLYPSHPPAKPGEPDAILGLRTYDGRPTAQLEALSELARELVPLGPVITHWDRTQVALATDARDLRAALFADPEATPYVVVYNRDPARELTGRVRIPFLCRRATDIARKGKCPLTPAGAATVVTVTLPPGDGTILRLSGRLPEAPGPDPTVAAEPLVCDGARPDLLLGSLPDGGRLFRYEVDFQKAGGVPPGEALTDEVQFQAWTDRGDPSMNGLWGTRLLQSFEMPANITAVSASAVFANHADAESKTYRVLYSTDGEQFLPLGETPSPGSARIEVKGRALLPRPGRKIWLSYVLPARSIGIVLKQAAVELILGGGAPGND